MKSANVSRSVGAHLTTIVTVKVIVMRKMVKKMKKMKKNKLRQKAKPKMS